MINRLLTIESMSRRSAEIDGDQVRERYGATSLNLAWLIWINVPKNQARYVPPNNSVRTERLRSGWEYLQASQCAAVYISRPVGLGRRGHDEGPASGGLPGPLLLHQRDGLRSGPTISDRDYAALLKLRPELPK